MWRGLSNHLRALLLAFLLALIVWVSAVTSADPDEERTFPSPIPIEIIGQDPSLIIMGAVPKQTEVTLRAPGSVWDKLTTRKDGIRALLDLSGLKAGEHNLELQIQVAERPARIVSVKPADVILQLETLASKSLKVEPALSGNLPAGFQAGDLVIGTEQVIVSGPESLVSQAERIRLAINLSGMREDIDGSLAPQVLDGKNQPITGLTLSPANIQAHLPVVQQGGYRDVAVKVVVQGQPASGYRLTNIASFPPVVTLFSTDPELVGTLPGYVETRNLDLNGANADISTRLELNLPINISVIGDQNVLVQAGVEAIESSLTLSNKRVEVVGLDPALNAHVAPDSVDVIISGPLPLLDGLAAQDVRVVVDVTNLLAGTHQLTPKVAILVSDLRLESILPATVEVILTSTAAPTPQP